mmetsp:Transcript_10209/g.13397  ORF Transcript_10209/g.13397 Transcript_10209/m.13397 type:complete len:186 (+) Transcript_10209:72-629(+)
MGQLFARILQIFSSISQKRILMLGLDAAGKTTILYKLNLGETIHTIPTIGFNVEKVQYKRLEFVVWDVGGQDKIRPLWRHYFSNTDALIYVVDSSDRDRIDLARSTLEWLLSEYDLQNVHLLIYANKQDIPNSLTPAELAKVLGLFNVRHQKWFIQSSCALSGDGLYEGLDWLAQAFKIEKRRSI